jgi:hypothetical protein
MHMLFSIEKKVRLGLIAPQNFCCNCGVDGCVALLSLEDTPLPITRYVVLFGSETTFYQRFPYCAQCKSSAKRVKPSVFGQFLTFCVAVAAMFLILVSLVSVMPQFVASHMFLWSMIFGGVLTFFYYRWALTRKSPRTFYQPVRLLRAEIKQSVVNCVELGFENAQYSQLMSSENSPSVEAGVLKIKPLN